MKFEVRHDVALWGILFFSFAFACVVYVYPMILSGDVFEAFDSFSYVGYLNENPSEAREAQRFLWLYPAQVLPSPALHVYGAFLHFLLLMPVALIGMQLGDRNRLKRMLWGLCGAEAMLFLATPSKEGLAIIAIFSCLCAHTLISEQKFSAATLLFFYGCLLGELSRPKFGLLIFSGFVLSLSPYLAWQWRRVLYGVVLFSLGLLAWYLLMGPGANDFTDRYQAGKTFLAWFELELASTSPVKAAVRDFFTLAFAPDEPSLWFLVLVFVLSVAKALVYVLAVPLISPPIFTVLPAQEWAICWQLAVSLMTVILLWGGLAVVMGARVDTNHRGMLIFCGILIYFLALSTFIFHVRYRAPGVVGLLVTLMSMNKVSVPLVVISSGLLCFAMLLYSIFWFI